MKIKPLNERVLIKLEEKEKITKGGIILLNQIKKDYREGTIKEIGKGYKLKNGMTVPLKVKKGDKVIFGKFEGSEVVLEGKNMVILKENHILGVVDD